MARKLLLLPLLFFTSLIMPATHADDGVQLPKAPYLALGDSYTIGESVAEKLRWPVQLANHLNRLGHSLGQPEIIAKTGWTTDELQEAIDKAKPVGDRKLVTLLIGVNNQYRGRSVSEYKEQFTALLEKSIELAQGKASQVIVVSIPDYGLTPFVKNETDREPRQIAMELNEFNLVAEKVCLERHVHWVDITSVSRVRGDEASMIAADGLHPSGKMYSQWVKEVLPVANQILCGASE